MEGETLIMCKFCNKIHPEIIVCTGKKKILFVYFIKNEKMWMDGLWAALGLLEKDFDITYWNIAVVKELGAALDHFDFILGWSSLDGEISYLMRKIKQPHGLCIGGYIFEPHNINHYNVLFYETEWYGKAELKDRHPNARHAFGINTQIYRPIKMEKIWDYTTIGSFSAWKRQFKLLEKEGNRLAVGQIQEGNMEESFSIISELTAFGVAIQGEVSPEILAKYINASKCIYLPATISGGSERSVLEARACGTPVEIEKDNPKLAELLTSPIWDEKYYADALKKGIESCLK
jgi:hypothetical protein